jgi:peptidoglycan/LPS O-acetylase OafA/YrhL
MVVSSDSAVPTACAPQVELISTAGYRRDIDGLRAIAILAVVLGHAGFGARGGWVGVDIFFVISGYLISGIIIEGLTRREFDLVNFYARRAKRLFPALVIVLSFVLPVSWLVLLPDELQRLGRDVVTGSVYVHNFFVYLGARENEIPIFPHIILTHLWSLSTEEQFYLLWPLVLMVGLRSRVALLIVIVAAAVVSLIAEVATRPVDPTAAYFLPWNRFWGLSLGAALACIQSTHVNASTVSLRWRITARKYGEKFGGAAALIMMLGSIQFLPLPNFFGWWALIPTAATCVLIWCGPHAWVNRCILGSRPMVFVGLISYPLYLWHQPLLVISGVVDWNLRQMWIVRGALLVAAFVLAYLTYRFVERPLRSTGNTRRAAAVSCVALACCAGVGYLLSSGRIPARSHSQQITAHAQAVGDRGGRSNREWFGEPTLASAPTVNFEAKRYTLFTGDSTVRQYYPRIHRLLTDNPHNSRGAVFAASEECDPWRTKFYGREQACERMDEAMQEFAKGDMVDTVVIGACWYCWLVDVDYITPSVDRGMKENADAILEKWTSFVASLRNSNKRVFVVLNIPLDPALDPRQMIERSDVLGGFKVADTFVATERVRRRLYHVTSKLRKNLEGTGAILIDPVNTLCDAKRCPSMSIEGGAVYADLLHIRGSYVREKVVFLDEAVQTN